MAGPESGEAGLSEFHWGVPTQDDAFLCSGASSREDTLVTGEPSSLPLDDATAPQAGASGPSWESLPCLPGQSTLLATLYKVLFRASKACRDWVLHTANRATITLAFLSLCSPAERQSQLAGAVRALSIRAAAPQASITPARSTALRVVLGDSQDMALQQMGVILDAVAEAGMGGIVTELQVSLQRPTMTKETADTVAETVAMLHRVAAVFPSLTTLSLDGWRFNAFPQLPRLRELRIVACRITEPSCVLANTPQLTHLHVTKVAQFGMGAAFWQALFASHVITQWRQSRQCATISYGGAGGASAAAGGAIRTNLNGSAAPSIGSSTTTTAADTPLPLTHFHTDEPLSTALCGILLAYAPALTHLSVAALNVTKSHADRQWALRCLHFNSHVPVQATALTSLPTGNYSVTTAAGAHVRAFVGDTQGIDPDVLAQLSHVHFQGTRIRLEAPWCTMSPEHTAVAMPTALGQLRGLRGEGLMVQVELGFWRTKVMRHAAFQSAIAAHSDVLRVVVCAKKLTDKLVGHILQLGSRIHGIEADRLMLKSTHAHANTVLPWVDIDIWDVNVGSLCELPCPARGRNTTITCQFIDLENVTDDNAHTVCQWLEHVTFKPHNESITIAGVQKSRLHSHMSVLNAMRFDMGSDTQCGVAASSIVDSESTSKLITVSGCNDTSMFTALDLGDDCALEPASSPEASSSRPMHTWDLDVDRHSDIVKGVCVAISRAEKGRGLPPGRVQVHHKGRNALVAAICLKRTETEWHWW